MYKICKNRDFEGGVFLEDFYYFLKHLIALLSILIGLCHLPADYLVNRYTMLYETNFNAQELHPQLIMLSWVKVIGVFLMVQGGLMLWQKNKSMLLSQEKQLKLLCFQLCINVALLISLFHPMVSISHLIWLPAVMVVLVHFILQGLFVYLYISGHKCR